MCDAVQHAGGLLPAQLSYSGRAVPAASAAENTGTGRPPQTADASACSATVLTESHIGPIVHDYARAASRARTVRFDAVQILDAHGVLLNQFLSPVENQRTDAYGGPLPHCARLLYEVHEAVRRAVGPPSLCSSS